MSIHKCKRKIALCIASIFWAACENDSSTAPDVNTPPESSETSEASISSSSEVSVPGSSETPASSEAAPAESSSSEATEPASSSSSVDPNYPYTLGLRPSVHCKDSTYYVPSPCASNRPDFKTVTAELAENEPLYGVPSNTCTIPARNDSIFKCDNGMIYFKRLAYATTNSFALVGDTIEQCAPTATTTNPCPSAKDYYTKIAEEAEASTDYPYEYKLANKTTLNCKEIYETKLDTIKVSEDNKREQWVNKSKYKCDDGNEYTVEDLQALTSKQSSTEPN